MSKELSAEWEQKIEQEGKEYATYQGETARGVPTPCVDGDKWQAYIDGASHYATLLIEAQERIKDLENSMRNIIRAIGAADYLGAKRIANEALSPVNPQKKEYPIGGFAPGNYYGKCHSCGKEYQGDKRSFQCEPCAIKAKEAFDALSIEEQSELIEKNAEEVRKFFVDLKRSQ